MRPEFMNSSAHAEPSSETLRPKGRQVVSALQARGKCASHEESIDCSGSRRGDEFVRRLFVLYTGVLEL